MVTDTLRNIKAEDILVLVKISPADVLNFFPAEHCVVCEFKLNEVLESLVLTFIIKPSYCNSS